ncbi:MAG: hypothetical protein K1X78_21685 [Verrucomicrobiaceae bacterium]|nr:hypothetical protein [Verrucomicrobiaceae bacterium]
MKNSLPALSLVSSQALLPGVLMLALSGCQLADIAKRDGKSKNKDEVDELYLQPKAASLPPEAQETTDIARLLAGLPSLSDQDANKKWRSESFWRTHASGMNKMWKEFGAKRGIKVRNWSVAELSDVASIPVVFQPFGGPNFVFSHLLIPNAETFVVCGKAPCLDIPKFDTIPEGVLADTIFQLRQASANILGLESEATSPRPGPEGQSLPGAMPMLLALAARTGHVIEAVELMPTDGGGSATVVDPSQIPLDPTAEAAPSSKQAHPTSACVITMRSGDGRQKRLFYFQQDMRDEGLPESAALLQYLNKQSRVVVVVHESAHELHQPNTMRIQRYIAKHAAALIQDPSGVPFRHFSPEAWNVQKYGSYAGAPSEYRNFDQPELIFAYSDKSSTPQALPFGTGLLHKELPTALMVVRPLVTRTSELPVNVDVTPLPEPPAVDQAEVAALRNTPASQETGEQKAGATAAGAAGVSPPAPAPAAAAPEPAATSALEASLAPPLAPVDLTPKP